ncbi:type VI secretion system contractile sheath large subunit [Marinomonas sp. S3726]|uniref:type VI secretion system contractile sheath large subunit n=1 Tax=Marinomonas sp. S3726 TaxID=579484 RepID=UPI001EE28843|nr:type VI secretion system contractile sheath large subunit [Marinomonas sp. S3726]
MMLQNDFQDDLNRLDAKDDDFLREALALLVQLDEQILSNPSVLRATIQRLITEIDAKLSEQLSAIMHHEDFKQLESSWRSIDSLVQLPINKQKTKVRIIDISWNELSHDVNSSVSLKRSHLYNLLGNKELNTSGGQPFGMIVVDHFVSIDFDQDYDDVYTLELLASLGESCLCPFVLSPSDNFFGGGDADWLSDTDRIEKILYGPEFDAWQRLRKIPASRFLGLAMPKVKLRNSYQNFCSNFVFNETYQKENGLWGSAAFMLASVAMREFNRISWFGFMKSRWQDQYYGALVNVPPTGAGSFCTKKPITQVNVITGMGAFYADQGFVPICHSLMTDKYYLRGNNSIWDSGTNETDKVMGQLQTTLMVCRISHYLKVQIRSMIGNFQTAQECEVYLNNWLDKYSSNLFNADEKTLAKFPLSKGKVTVREVAGHQGRYVCDVLVQPQYQFDHVCGEVLLSTDIGPEDVSSRGVLS